ncbi:MAG: hypothetical protein P4L76_03540, partial [Beijerinckiaceae bacterium]|nr:hypothetical protein [Beijerinckiaceae bacterium]
PVCDAFGAAHLGAGLIGAAGCALLAALSNRLPGRLARLIAAGGIAVLAAGYVALFYPACLRDPFANVAPLVRAIWLSNVTESLPFPRFFREDPQGALLTLMPVALGLCGTLAGAILWRGITAARFLLVSALIGTGLAMGFWQIRVFTSVTPLAVAGALPLAIALHGRAKQAGRNEWALLALCLVFPFTSAAWGLVLPDDTGTAPTRAGNKCLAPASFAPLAALPPGRVVAPIDSGAYFLVHTQMTVFAAPYHRDNAGNLLMLESLMAKPEDAFSMLSARGADYVAICPGFGETQALAKRAPESLAANLLAGRIPDWLAPVPMNGTPYLIFRVSPSKN